MKLITLVPVKNEEWILRLTLRNFSLFSDEILLLNDGSADATQDIARTFPKVTLIDFETDETHVNMSKRRNLLLKKGRELGGTHFVMLDADECFSFSFTQRIQKEIASLSPGQSLCLPWIFVFNQNSEPVIDVQQHTIFKDFIFCDDKISFYTDAALSESRTPAKLENCIRITEKGMAVFHFQYFSEKRNQLKQIWYRCNELLEGNRSPRRINATYNFTKHFRPRLPVAIEDAFIKENISAISLSGDDLMFSRIESLFERKGVDFFEPLDIWYLPETHNYFISHVHREPRIQTFPYALIVLNSIKNAIINRVRKG